MAHPPPHRACAPGTSSSRPYVERGYGHDLSRVEHATVAEKRGDGAFQLLHGSEQLPARPGLHNRPPAAQPLPAGKRPEQDAWQLLAQAVEQPYVLPVVTYVSSVLPTQPVALQGVTAGKAAQPVAVIPCQITG